MHEDGFVDLTQEQVVAITQSFVDGFKKPDNQEIFSSHQTECDTDVVDNFEITFYAERVVARDIGEQLFSLHDEIYTYEYDDDMGIKFSVILKLILDKVHFNNDEKKWCWTGSDYSVSTNDDGLTRGYFTELIKYSNGTTGMMYYDIWLKKESSDRLSESVKNALVETMNKEGITSLANNAFKVIHNNRKYNNTDCVPF